MSGAGTGKVAARRHHDQLAGRKVRASKDDPQYLVRSDKSGGDAVHKPSALRKNSDGDRRRSHVAWRCTPHRLLGLRIRCA